MAGAGDRHQIKLGHGGLQALKIPQIGIGRTDNAKGWHGHGGQGFDGHHLIRVGTPDRRQGARILPGQAAF